MVGQSPRRVPQDAEFLLGTFGGYLPEAEKQGRSRSAGPVLWVQQCAEPKPEKDNAGGRGDRIRNEGKPTDT